MLSGDVGNGAAQVPELLARGRDIGMRFGHDFDLRLQKLAAHAIVGRVAGGLEEVMRHAARDELGLRVDQEIFFLDAERVVASHSSPRLKTGHHHLTWAEMRRLPAGGIIPFSTRQRNLGSIS